MEALDSELKRELSAVLSLWNIQSALKKKQLQIKSNGHWFGKIEPRHFIVGLNECGKNRKSVYRSIKLKKPLKQFLKIGQSIHDCSVCAEKINFVSNGKLIKPEKPCKYPHGFVYSFELNVPSGTIVFQDDLREWFDVAGDFNINTVHGTILKTKHMAEIGCAHCFVGNTCPSVYKLNDKQFYVGHVGYYQDGSTNGYRSAKYIGDIITDLWWFSMVDAQELYKRSGKNAAELKLKTMDIKPGVYKFKYLYYQNGYNERNKTQPYAVAQWVRAPDPVRDFQSEYLARNFTAEQIVHQGIRSWPMLYNGPDAIQQKANHIFCVCGGGGSWHPNGFVQYDAEIKSTEPETKIPIFQKTYYWSEISEYSNLWIAAGLRSPKESIHLNPSFRRLAFNAAYCIYKHGTKCTYTNSDKEKIKALKVLKGLAKLYPNDVPKRVKAVINS